jgi:hypothetical protein
MAAYRRFGDLRSVVLARRSADRYFARPATRLMVVATMIAPNR